MEEIDTVHLSNDTLEAAVRFCCVDRNENLAPLQSRKTVEDVVSRGRMNLSGLSCADLYSSFSLI